MVFLKVQLKRKWWRVMGRKKAEPATPASPKPKVFIGSSSEGLIIAQAIKANLDRIADVDIWPHLFELSKTTIESLDPEQA